MPAARSSWHLDEAFEHDSDGNVQVIIAHVVPEVHPRVGLTCRSAKPAHERLAGRGVSDSRQQRTSAMRITLSMCLTAIRTPPELALS